MSKSLFHLLQVLGIGVRKHFGWYKTVATGLNQLICEPGHTEDAK